MLIKPKRALLSLSDKEGLIEFAEGLDRCGIEIVSTGGTAKLLKEKGFNIVEISDFTGFPEILDGRVKTLNPKVHAGILNIRENEEHRQTMEKHGFVDIDIVAVNLYPFEKTINSTSVTTSQAIENIDIGGPTMIRSAAKNFKYVTVVVDKQDYAAILNEIDTDGGVTLETRMDLARKAFTHTAMYDSIISGYFNNLMEIDFPDEIAIPMRKKQGLRYGENPHQKASFYTSPAVSEPGVTNAHQLHGKELSFNNIIDTNAALELVKEFDTPVCVIVKHTNPCGVALADDITQAYKNALECDPLSAFGGIVGLNREVDKNLAENLSEIFLEVVAAPSFSKDAVEILTKKKNIRLLEIKGDFSVKKKESDMKKVVGGYLLQEKDIQTLPDDRELKIVTKKQPTDDEYNDLLFAWTVAKHVKSNAIVYAKDNRTIGVGAGQMSRVDSSKIAAEKARSSLEGSVMASDAFFPFRDSIDEAADREIMAVIQPGGSIRDDEVIKAADEHGMAMVFTGMRHFKH